MLTTEVHVLDGVQHGFINCIHVYPILQYNGNASLNIIWGSDICLT